MPAGCGKGFRKLTVQAGFTALLRCMCKAFFHAVKMHDTETENKKLPTIPFRGNGWQFFVMGFSWRKGVESA